MFAPDLLRSFKAVAESGGFTNAATLLNSTQSTISAQIHRLEDEADLEVELEIGLGPRLFEMVESQELDLAVGGLCNGQAKGRRLWSEPLVWAYSAGAEVPGVLPMAFFPAPCPYREAGLRALAGSQKQWRIVSTCSSLAGVRAAAMAGLAVTPIPLQTIKPGLRIVSKKYKMPKLPEIEFVLHMRESDTRPTVAGLGNLIREMAGNNVR